MAKPTKKSRLEQARALIDKNTIGVPFSPSDTLALNECMGTAFEGFARKINPRFSTDARHLHALSNGVWAATSWNKAIMPLPYEQLVKRVMRQSIASDMRDYMQSANRPACNRCSSTVDLTVDHTPPFDCIVLEFVALHGYPAIQDRHDDVGKKFADIIVETAWIAFHRSRIASLHILCRSCNASKGKHT